MTLYDVLLFLHVFGAFALVAGIVAMAPFSIGIGKVALARDDQTRLAMIGTALYGLGATLTLVIGLWLVGNVGYEFFRFWVIGALVLWMVIGWANSEVTQTARSVRTRTGEAQEAERDLRVLWLVQIGAAALLLVLMVWKPGH